MTNQPTPKTGAEVLVKTLEALGVEYIFGYSGGAVIPIFDAIVTVETNIQLITVRHEQGAVHMADGYARATGKPGVVLVTSGPGAGNAVTGLMTAHMDSVPLLLISGQQISSVLGLDAFQEADVINLTLPVVKHSYQLLSADAVAATIQEAYYISMAGRPGPVVVDVPKDVSSAPCRWDPAVIQKPVKATSVTNPKALQRIADAINASERPLLLVGQGVIIADSTTDLRQLVETFQIPVVTTLLGKGAVDENHPLSLGMLGMHGTAYANKAIQETDCLVTIGSRFDDRIVGDAPRFAEQATICHIDVDPTEITKMVQSTCNAVADAKAALGYLQDHIQPKARPAWFESIQHLKQSYPLQVPSGTTRLTQQYVLHELDKATQDQAIIATDVGQHQMWAAQFCRTARPRHFLTSGGAGTMGFGMPAAIGAQLAFPDKTVVSISGDGGFQMTQAELATAAINKLPIKILILDNKYLGMVRQWQEMFYDNRESGVSLEGNPDFSLLAAAYGIKSVHITQVEEAASQLREALLYNQGPVLIWCEVAKTDNVFPMIPAGRAYSHMLLEPPTVQLEKPTGST